MTNQVGEEIAEMKRSLWSWNMGTTTIVIVGASGEDQGEVVEIKPVGFGRRAQVTVSFLRIMMSSMLDANYADMCNTGLR